MVTPKLSIFKREVSKITDKRKRSYKSIARRMGALTYPMVCVYIVLLLRWSDDKYWLPVFLARKKFDGVFEFDDESIILRHTLKEVQELPPLPPIKARTA